MASSFSDVKIFMHKAKHEPRDQWLLCTTPDTLYMLETLESWKDKGIFVPYEHTQALRKIIATEARHVEY